MKRLLYSLFTSTGFDRLLLRVNGRRLRILAYHGICDDRAAGEPWVPPYFVRASAFADQLAYLQRHTSVLPLSRAIGALERGTLPHRAVSITFDDGYANNLQVGYPLLEKHGLPATIFLSTAPVETGEFYPFIRLRLIRLAQARTGTRAPGLAKPLPDYKREPLDRVLTTTEEVWQELRPDLSPGQTETLRPLRPEEVRRFDPQLIEFGAHSHTHCILGNETPERRQREISVSVQKVAEWTGKPATLFSYPNGQPGNFDEQDKQALRAQGIAAAVTTIPGANRAGSDPLELKRYPVGLLHDATSFPAEVSGLRTAVRVITRTTNAYGSTAYNAA